jgi:hypothetical protein
VVYDTAESGRPMVSTENPDVEVIHRAIDVLHVRLVSREDGSHVHWHWQGHDRILTKRCWSTRTDAIAYMRQLLDDRSRDR